jgi:hypothetical protein
MPDHPNTTNPPTKPLDIVARLLVLAHASEVSVAGPARPQVAALVRETASEIQRLLGLRVRLNNLLREGQCC